MGVRHHLVTLFGYDATIVAGLSPRHRRHLSWVSGTSVLPCLLVGGSAGYGIWMVEGSISLAIAVGLGFVLIVLNLLRAAVAGGGAAPHLRAEEAARWRPRATPVVLLGFLGLFFAQPAQLPLHAADLDPDIEAYRRTLVQGHARVVMAPLARRLAELSAQAEGIALRLTDPRGSDPESLRADLMAVERRRQQVQVAMKEAVATNLVVYARHTDETAFAARRIQLSWANPRDPAIFTGVFCFLVLLPLLLARGPRLAAVRAHEVERWRRTRAAVARWDQDTRDQVQVWLERWPTFRPSGPRFFDPPFNRERVPQVGQIERVEPVVGDGSDLFESLSRRSR